ASFQHSLKSNPHPLALALPLTHTGQNPPYDFLTRHPTPHAQRHDLYVAQPQCRKLVANNTFVFSIRQHPSSLSAAANAGPTMAGGAGSHSRAPSRNGAASPNPYTRPISAMSNMSVSAAGSNFSAPSSNASSSSSGNNGGHGNSNKPAKLAIQSPSGRIIRLVRKQEQMASSGKEEDGDGTVWETVVKLSERGVWRALVLADRSARWCVFGEWECV
ncbi:hypothetical protein LTS18_000893, partial [Coniosporium uncinatum]